MDLFETLAVWRKRLTGVRESTAGGSLDEGVECILRWNARRLVCEQMLLLEMASLMVRHKLGIRDLSRYFGSKQVVEKPLGRLGFVSGVQGFVRYVYNVLLPVLRSGAYRPFIRSEVARAMLALEAVPGLPPGVFDLGNAADAFYRQGTSPYAATNALKSLRNLAKRHPEALPQMLQAIGIARREATEDIALLEDAEALSDAFSTPQDADPQA